jgi:hypothetical protein
MEIMRLQTYCLINIQLAKEDKLKDVREIIKFPWDAPLPPVEVYIPTDEEWEIMTDFYVKGIRPKSANTTENQSSIN